MSRNWYQEKWERCVEDEFGEPARDVVQGMHHDMMIPIHVIAGALGVCHQTLSRWCKNWGIEIRGHSYCTHTGAVQKRAVGLGYDSIEQAISSMRVSGMRRVDIIAELRCSQSTITRYLREDYKGRSVPTEVSQETRRHNAIRVNQMIATGLVERGGFVKVPLQMVCPIGPDSCSRI